jgi:hypothetical protein
MNGSNIRRVLLGSLIVLFSVVSLQAVVLANPVPLLYPLTPSAALPGSSGFAMTVRGAGFVSGSTVDWNGTALVTTFVSSSVLTATVPAADLTAPNTATITVVSPAPGGGTSNFQYFVVEDSVPQNYFSSRSITGNANLTSPITGGDFNNDGRLDIIVASGPNVYVLAGNGDGSFGTAHGSVGPSNSVIAGIHVADVNGDGKQDLIINGRRGTTGVLATMLGNGDGSFQAPIETDFTGVTSASVVVADFNHDGILDIALVSSGYAKVMLGNGDGTFHAGTPTFFSAYAGRDGIAAADFNGDGNLDLIITAYDPFSTTGYSFVGYLQGVGDGTFADIVPVSGSAANFAGSITAAIGDFNGDGKLDIATAIQTTGATIQGLIYISIGNGDGTFTQGTSVPNVSSVTTPLLVGDFNADGVLDLATGGYFYFGSGSGSFPNSNGSSGAPTFVYAGDANNDGLLDVIDETVITTHSNSGTTTTEAAGIELQVAPLADFKGVVAPLTTTLVPGSSVSFTVTIVPLYGWTGDVTMGATNLPNGITPSYNPVTVKGGNGTTTITLTAASTLPLGNYTFTLSGNSGGLTHSTVVPVTVNNSVGDFGGSVSPSIANIAQSGSASYPITITPTAGFNAPVFLSVTGLPSGATASFSQNPINGGSGSSTLTITTTGSTPSPSVDTITVTAISGTLVHSHSVYLGVAPAAEQITGSITPSNSVSASAGGTANYALNLATSNNSAASDMNLSVSGVPAGATASFVPLSINTGTGSSTLQVTAPAGAVAQGSYSLTITMTVDGAVAQQSVVLNVGP